MALAAVVVVVVAAAVVVVVVAAAAAAVVVVAAAALMLFRHQFISFVAATTDLSSSWIESRTAKKIGERFCLDEKYFIQILLVVDFSCRVVEHRTTDLGVTGSNHNEFGFFLFPLLSSYL